MTAPITWETGTAKAGKPMDAETLETVADSVLNDADLLARAQNIAGPTANLALAAPPGSGLPAQPAAATDPRRCPSAKTESNGSPC
jgi:hypothetical protein